jgi:hypothetical protein
MAGANLNLAAQHYLKESFEKAHEDQFVHPVLNKYMVIGDRVEEVKTIQVFEFTVEDVDDPDIYAADPLMKWERSEQGQWIMTNALEVPAWHPIQEPMTYGYRYIVKAKLTGPKLTEWLLRYG